MMQRLVLTLAVLTGGIACSVTHALEEPVSRVQSQLRNSRRQLEADLQAFKDAVAALPYDDPHGIKPQVQAVLDSLQIDDDSGALPEDAGSSTAEAIRYQDLNRPALETFEADTQVVYDQLQALAANYDREGMASESELQAAQELVVATQQLIETQQDSVLTPILESISQLVNAILEAILALVGLFLNAFSLAFALVLGLPLALVSLLLGVIGGAVGVVLALTDTLVYCSLQETICTECPLIFGTGCVIWRAVDDNVCNPSLFGSSLQSNYDANAVDAGELLVDITEQLLSQ